MSVAGLGELSPKVDLVGILHLPDGSEREIQLRHSLTASQIDWFRAGSCWNAIRAQEQAA